EAYQFGEVARELHGFFWNEFCDWYIEFSKSALQQDGEARLQTQRNLVYVLDNALRLLHPAMPFVTEAIWEKLPHGDQAPALMMAAWPEPEKLACWKNEEAERAIDLVCGIVGAVRSVRARYGISPKQELAVAVKAANAQDAALIDEQRSLIESLARTASLTAAVDADKPAESSATLISGCEVYCVLSGLVDFAAERERLLKERDKLQKESAKVEKKLSNPGYLAKAKPEIVEKDKAKYAELEAKIDLVVKQIAELG
ncbi:MAG: class I tRNA ligase family protein, partial [Slackia piriformis]|nr:class I tRNA ligase family protein [Slackia piriformis]